jgi:hypothetical protein
MTMLMLEPGQRSRHRDWLRAGRPRGQSASFDGGKNFTLSLTGPALGPNQPPIHWVPRTISQGVKRLGREADHSPPTIAEVKKMWIYIPTPPYAFMV